MSNLNIIYRLFNVVFYLKFCSDFEMKIFNSIYAATLDLSMSVCPSDLSSLAFMDIFSLSLTLQLTKDILSMALKPVNIR